MNHKILSNLAKLFSSNVLAKLMGMLVIGFFSRVLSREELAIIPAYYMVTSLSQTLIGFGILPNMIKQLPALLKEDIYLAKQLIFMSSIVLIGGSLLVSLVIYFKASSINEVLFDNQYTANLIRLFAFGVITLTLNKIALQVLWASGEFGKKSLLLVFESLIRSLLSIGLFFIFGFYGIVFALLITQFIVSVISVIMIRKLLSFDYSVNIKILDLLKTSFPFYLEGFMMYFRRYGDNWIIAIMLGPASLSIYYIAKVLYGALYMLHNSIDQVVTNVLATYKNEYNSLLNCKDQIFKVITPIIIPFLSILIFLLPILVPVLAGKKYINAVLPSTFLFLALLVDFIRIVVARTLFITLPSMVRFYNTLFESIILLVALYLLSASLHATGVAISRLISQIMSLSFGYYILKRTFDFSLDFSMLFLMIFIFVLPSFLAVLLNYLQILDALNQPFQYCSLFGLWLLVSGIIWYKISLKKISFSFEF